MRGSPPRVEAGPATQESFFFFFATGLTSARLDPPEAGQYPQFPAFSARSVQSVAVSAVSSSFRPFRAFGFFFDGTQRHVRSPSLFFLRTCQSIHYY